MRRAWRSFTFRLALVVCLVFSGGAVAVYQIEHGRGGDISSLGEAFWWLLVTVTTVGYGDLTPVTLGGRIVASIMIVMGVAMIPLVASRVVSYTIERRLMEERGSKKIKMRNHTVVCGWNERLDTIIDALVDSQVHQGIAAANSLAVEDMTELLLKYKPVGLRFAHGDITSETILDLANIGQAACTIVLSDLCQGDISSADQRAVLTTLAVRAMNPRARICAEVTEPSAAFSVRNAGADEVIAHGEHDPFLLASAATAEGIVLAAQQLLSRRKGSKLRQRSVPQEFVGKTFAELSSYFSDKNGAILIGLVHSGKSLRAKDVLSGDYSMIDGFIERMFKEEGKEYLMSQLEVPQIMLNPGDEYTILDDDVAILIGY